MRPSTGQTSCAPTATHTLWTPHLHRHTGQTSYAPTHRANLICTYTQIRPHLHPYTHQTSYATHRADLICTNRQHRLHLCPYTEQTSFATDMDMGGNEVCLVCGYKYHMQCTEQTSSAPTHRADFIWAIHRADLICAHTQGRPHWHPHTEQTSLTPPHKTDLICTYTQDKASSRPHLHPCTGPHTEQTSLARLHKTDLICTYTG